MAKTIGQTAFAMESDLEPHETIHFGDEAMEMISDKNVYLLINTQSTD